MKESKKFLLILNLLTFLFTVFLEVYETLLPFILVNLFGASMVIVGLVEGIGELLSNFLKILGGYLSDIKGNKKVLSLGILFFSIANFLIALAKKWDILQLSVIFKSFGEGFFAPSMGASISIRFKKKLGKFFAINKIFENFGELVGVFLAFLISLYFFKISDFKMIFLISSITLFFLFLVSMFLNISIKQEKKTLKKRITWKILYPELFIYFSLMSFVNLGYSFYILKVFEYTKETPETILLYFIFTIVLVILTYIAGLLYDKLSLNVFFYIISILYFITNLMFIFNPIIAIILLAISEGFLEVGIWGTIGSKVKFRKGFIFGLYHFFIGISTFISSIIAGFIWDNFSSDYPFLLGSLISLLSIFIIRIFKFQ